MGKIQVNLVAKLASTLALGVGLATPAASLAKDVTYKASVETRGERKNDNFVVGFVFEDYNRDGVFQRDREPGIPGVLVSNGRDVVRTNDRGRYRLPNIYDRGHAPTRPEAMSIFITKPSAYDVPVDKDNVPQFFYHHIPGGSPKNVRGEDFRFGGLPASGRLPRLINFPLIEGEHKSHFRIVVSGDTQPYSNTEVGYVRDTIAREWATMPDLEAVIVEGDVMGDDLDLYPRFKNTLSLAKAPQYYVAGNHDLDFDAPTDKNSFDTFKREWGPAYYSFDIGDVHFVVLDDVKYPCTPTEDNLDGLHGNGNQCDTPTTSPTYNGVVSAEQIEWLRNDLAHVPTDKLIVLKYAHSDLLLHRPKHRSPDGG